MRLFLLNLYIGAMSLLSYLTPGSNSIFARVDIVSPF